MADQLSTGPNRACRLLLDLQADTMEDLAADLRNFWVRLDRGELGGGGVSGGYSGGYIYELRFSDTPSHDEYVQQLDAYLAAIKNKPAEGAA